MGASPLSANFYLLPPSRLTSSESNILKSIVRGEGGWRYTPHENVYLVKDGQVCEQNYGRSS